LGVNLGPIGVFGKFSYNGKIARQLTGEDAQGYSYPIPYYGPWNSDLGKFDQYVPALRVTVGAKLIL